MLLLLLKYVPNTAPPLPSPHFLTTTTQSLGKLGTAVGDNVSQQCCVSTYVCDTREIIREIYITLSELSHVTKNV